MSEITSVNKPENHDLSPRTLRVFAWLTRLSGASGLVGAVQDGAEAVGKYAQGDVLATYEGSNSAFTAGVYAAYTVLAFSVARSMESRADRIETAIMAPAGDANLAPSQIEPV